MADYHLEDIYQGGYSTLDPNSGFKGYRLPAYNIGLATDPRTANILQEVSAKLQSGAKQIEVSSIKPDVFESIPNEQLKEVRRLSELTGADISVHGILIGVEPSGIGQQGFNELSREETERQMISNVLRAHELNPKGNIPVTFHSSVSWQGPEYKKTEEGVETKERIPIINQETGQVGLVKSDVRFMVGMTAEELEKGDKTSAEEYVGIRNRTEWSDSIANLVAIKERADRMISETEPLVREIQKKFQAGVKPGSLGPTEKDVLNRYHSAGIELGEIQKHLNASFERAYKYGENKKELIVISENFGKSLDSRNNPNAGFLSEQSRAMAELIDELGSSRKIAPPEVYKPLEEFAIEKTATTFANVALRGYKEFHDTAPIISIENPPAGGGLSRSEDLKNLVRMSRDKFVETAVKDGISEREAREASEKLIGVTWDVGHINMLRKYGFTEKDIIKEAENIAPIVKHVHLSDNFGMEHTELPMGMGNVPIKAIMEKLGQKGFEARKVIEAANWFEHFKTSPFQQTLEAFGSPIYGIKMQPYWNQAVGSQGYFSGYGQMLPQINYETVGSGFSALPAELGGQRQGAQGSRMSGRPME